MRNARKQTLADDAIYCLKFFIPAWIMVAVCVWALS